MDLPRFQAACAALVGEVAQGRLRDDTLYVPDPGSEELLARAGAACHAVDGGHVCVAAKPTRSPTP